MFGCLQNEQTHDFYPLFRVIFTRLHLIITTHTPVHRSPTSPLSYIAASITASCPTVHIDVPWGTPGATTFVRQKLGVCPHDINVNGVTVITTRVDTDVPKECSSMVLTAVVLSHKTLTSCRPMAKGAGTTFTQNFLPVVII